MKKLGLFLIGIIFITSAFAQKREVTSAWNFLKDGFLDDAKKSIDKAAVHQDTKEWYKTYYYKGQIYQELGISDKAKYKALCNSCLDTAYDAYIKAIRLNFVDPEYKNLDLTTETGLMKFISIIQQNDDRNYENTESLYDIIGNRFPALSNAFINEGVAKYQEQKWEEAYKKFEKAIMIATLSFRIDTQLYYFTSLAALKAQKYEEAVELNEFLIQSGYGANDDERVLIILNQATCYKQLGKTDKMIETLQKGIEKYPNNNYPLVIEMFNYYVNSEQNDKALEYINLAIEKNPNDPQFYVIRGTLHETSHNKDKAISDYMKAIELDPNNFDANYSAGAFYYNTGVDTLDWADKNIPITEFQKAEEYKKIANDLFAKSKPFLEKADALQPNNINVLSTLKTIYYRLGEMEKYAAIDEKIKALTE